MQSLFGQPPLPTSPFSICNSRGGTCEARWRKGTGRGHGTLELKSGEWNHLRQFGHIPARRQVAGFLYRLIMLSGEIRRCSYDRAWKHVLCLQPECYLLESVPGFPTTLNFRNQSHHKRKVSLSSASWINYPSNSFRGTAHLPILKIKCLIAKISLGVSLCVLTTLCVIILSFFSANVLLFHFS